MEQRRARHLLDEILDGLELDVRTVFVLFELEELTAPEISELLGIPIGTVASRLRRAREDFRSELTRRTSRALSIRSKST
jgi:RNA polymerase sigma-70 factor (ECF subfamily)